MNRATLLALLLATTLLSGCVGSVPGASDGSETTQSARSDETVDSVNAVNATVVAPHGVDADGNATAPSWFALDMDAAVTAFRWTVPENATRTYTYGSGRSMEVVPVVATLLTDSVESYGVFLYDPDDGAFLGSHIAAPFEVESYALLPTPQDFTSEVEARPFVWFLDDDHAGKELGVVVATTGLAAGSGFSWALMDAVPDTWDDVPETQQDYLDERAGPVGAVEATGTATTFLFSEYAEVYYGLATSPGVFGYTLRAGEATVEEHLPTWVPPYGGARDTTVTLDHPVDGWSVAYQYAWTETAAGTFELGVDLHGTEGGVSGAVADAPFTSTGLTWLLTGLPYVYAVGEGAGGATATMDVQTVTDNEFYLNVLYMASFDATLDDLLGVPAEGGVSTYDGVVPLLEGAPVGMHRLLA